jgi:hypothetical protein
MIITHAQLREVFVSAQLKHYFDKKLAPLPSNEVDIRIEETLKFLNMATYITGNIPVSKEIDELWHYWILETQEYRKLCVKLHGGKFLHHTSNDYQEYADPDVADRGIDLEQEVAILSAYVLNYGSFALERVKYWPLAERLMRQRGWDIDALNAWLACASVLASAEAVAA